jgi:type I restriction enzyme S subunit
MSEYNKTRSLPLGWECLKLEDICDKISLNKIKIKQSEYLEEGMFPVVDQGQQLIGGYFNDQKLLVPDEPPYVVFGDHTKIRKYVNFKFIAGADGIKVLKAKRNVDPKYLYYLLLFVRIEDKGYARHFQILEKQLFPVPTKRIQIAIVAKIEELFSELDKGIESLRIAQQQLKTYSQSVLKWAFEGRLTETWRAGQRNLGTGYTFFEQLKEEKNRRQKELKLKLKPLPGIAKEELNELVKLPSEFIWVRLGDLVWSVKDGPHYSPKYENKGIPFLSGGNIRPGGIDFVNVKFISKNLHEELSQRCKPEKGDVLYTKGGTTGIARVNTYDVEFNVWVHVAVLKLLSQVNPFYLQHALNSVHCYKQSQKYTHGVGNQDLGLTRMILIILPICSYEEQTVIVEEIDWRLSVADNIEECINKSLQEAETLRQSILKKAFEGKLV